MFELLFDNGGGITLITPNYCSHSDDAECMAYDVADLSTARTPKSGTGTTPSSGGSATRKMT